MSSESDTKELCKYGREKEVIYFDDRINRYVNYKCPHDAVKDGYCIFHHPRYWKENPNEVRDRFIEEINIGINDKKDVICIGYHLPEIFISDLDITEVGYVDFSQCEFHQNIDFLLVKFPQYANFRGAKFYQGAYFVRAEFQNVNFVGAEFQNAYFNNAKFYQNANFNSSVFHQDADFSRTKSYQNVEFMWTKFQNAKFYRAEFQNVNFTNVKIKYANFSHAIFEGIAVFKNGDDELNSKDKSQTDSILLFHLVTFKNPQNVTFIHFPLSSLSFLMTDVSNILIICDPIEIRKKGILSERLLRVAENKENRINNEFVGKAIQALTPHLSKETVLAEYRNIRKSFENNRTFAEASELFIREMRMLRKDLSILEKIAHWFYDGLSRYGESFLRPSALLIGSIFTIPIVENYLLGHYPFEDYLSNVEATARLFFQLPTERNYGGLEVLIRLFSITLLGNIFIAFRRRLERK